jgi:CBS domain-containing protein
MTAQVKEWMSGDPVAIEPEASALEAFDLMLDHGIRHLPVVDRSRRVVGVLSIDDLRSALPLAATPRATLGPAARTELRGYLVGELMTFAPETVREDTALEEAASLLANRRIGCLPVVESQGGLVGILSETDALRALAGLLWTDRVRLERGARAELDALVDRLGSERERIKEALARYAEVEREFTIHPQEVPVDFSERASDRSEVERAGIFRGLAERRLEQLERALDRAREGRLARCERCGGPIPTARLQALPGTTWCVACAREIEVHAGP